MPISVATKYNLSGQWLYSTDPNIATGNNPVNLNLVKYIEAKRIIPVGGGGGVGGTGSGSTGRTKPLSIKPTEYTYIVRFHFNTQNNVVGDLNVPDFLDWSFQSQADRDSFMTNFNNIVIEAANFS